MSDADCGVALDRRKYHELGPDGEDVPPNNIVNEMTEHAIEGVREEYPVASKRSVGR